MNGYFSKRDVQARMLKELRDARARGASGAEQLAILHRWAPFLADFDSDESDSDDSDDDLRDESEPVS